MAFSSNSAAGGPMADINVTPLVDVMLVLLIIFMVTAPTLSYPIDIDLPQPSLNPPPQTKAPPEPIKLRIDAVGPGVLERAARRRCRALRNMMQSRSRARPEQPADAGDRHRTTTPITACWPRCWRPRATPACIRSASSRSRADATPAAHRRDALSQTPPPGGVFLSVSHGRCDPLCARRRLTRPPRRLRIKRGGDRPHAGQETSHGHQHPTGDDPSVRAAAHAALRGPCWLLG